MMAEGKPKTECLFKDIYKCGGGKLINSSRIETIVSASQVRRDNLHLRRELSDGPTISCHKNCVSKYVSPAALASLGKHAQDEKAPENDSKRLRSSECAGFFDFRKHCLFCIDITPCILPHEYDTKVPHRYRKPASLVTTDKMGDGKTSYTSHLLTICNKRGDELGNIVRARILGAQSDLHAADARYHRKCNCLFHRVGNSQDNDNKHNDQALSQTLQAIGRDHSKIWNSLDVQAIYTDLGGEAFSRRSLVHEVMQNFGDELVSLNSPGKATLLVFKKHVPSNFRFIDDEETDDLEECVRKVGKKIKQETRDLKREFKSYNKNISRAMASECVSETLTKLLSVVSPKFADSLQSIMVGNIVSSMVTFQPTPLQIALGVLLGDHKMLITELHNYDVCCSYDEVRRFKRSAAVQSAKAKMLPGLRDATEGGLVQIIIDNFDAVINSQNCRLECHYMAMLATQWRADLDHLDGVDTTIPRISKEDMKQELPWEVLQVKYEGPKKPAMPMTATNSFTMSDAFVTATKVSEARARDIDIAFFRDVLLNDNTPEYNGYNTQFCRESGMNPAPKSAVVYLPLINMKASDPNTVLTSMHRGLQITRDSNQEIMVLTCDQQIYKIVVDITFHQPELLTGVVAILGGMHFLMDFVGCIGTLMADSGLKDILSTTFGSVDKMLQGKKYPQNVRALRLLTEEILRPVFQKYGPQITNMDDLEQLLDELSSESRTTKMWVTNVIKPTLLMMRFCRASHEGDWPLHISTVEAMLPYMFAANKHNYSRYGLYFVRSMTWLDPEILDKFCEGQQSLHHNAGLYNGQWSDMFIETNWMRKGHGPGGVIGMTENPQTLATWAYSMNATMALTGDLKNMTGDVESLHTRHKEEAPSRIRRDRDDRRSLQAALECRVDPMDPGTHDSGCLLNISNGQIAQPNVNVDKALEIGKEQLTQFESSWPNGFYSPLSHQVITFSDKKKQISVEKFVDQEAIYARVIGLLVSQRDLDLQQVLATELAAYPPSMFQADGQMRLTTGKSVLKNNLQVEVSQRLLSSPTAVVIDVSAVLWIVHWPANGLVETFINGFKVWLSGQLSGSDVHLCFDRYQEYSTKSATRSARAPSSRVHQLNLKTPLPSRDAVLKNSSNKARLNVLLFEQILGDNEFLQMSTQNHRLVVTGDDPVPTEVSRGRSLPRLDLETTFEEADMIIAQQAIHLARENEESRIRVVSDDTDVFVLLIYFVFTEGIQASMTMESPVKGRACIDIRESVRKHTTIIPSLLPLHALTGCDTVAASFGIGKTKALAVARKGHQLLGLGKTTTDMNSIIKEATQFMAACYGISSPVSSMTECRQLLWAQKTGKSQSAPKLCSLPPTTESFELNVKRAHHQVAQWYSAITGVPPGLSPTDYGWEKDCVNKSLIPRNLPDGVQYAPEHILKLVKCGCSSQQPCHTGRCSCMGHQLVCTIFCACGSGSTCCNPFKEKRSVSSGDSDDSDDEDND